MILKIVIVNLGKIIVFNASTFRFSYQNIEPVAPLNLSTITDMLSLLPRVIAIFTMVAAICLHEISSLHKLMASWSESSSQMPSEAITRYLSKGLTVYF